MIFTALHYSGTKEEMEILDNKFMAGDFHPAVCSSVKEKKCGQKLTPPKKKGM